MKHVFIFDPKSFQKQPWKMDIVLDGIGQYFSRIENPDFSILISRYRRHAIFLIQKQIEEAGEGNTVRVYAAGGNEILYDCLNGIAGLPGAELAFISYDISSDFFRFYGEEKKESFRDISSLAEAPAVQTDIIAAGSSYALNTCFVGLPSAISVKTKDIAWKYNNMPLIGSLSAVLKKLLVSQQYKVTIDDNDYSGNYSFINIANGPYYAGRKTAMAHAIPDDGMLDVALMESAAPLKTYGSMRKYFSGKKPGNCIILRAKKISIQSNEPMWLQLDSEFSRNSSITFEVVPAAVQIVAANDLKDGLNGPMGRSGQ